MRRKHFNLESRVYVICILAPFTKEALVLSSHLFQLKEKKYKVNEKEDETDGDLCCHLT
jgi:hemolysin-activating ACP:hemolysin acyltransferase